MLMFVVSLLFNLYGRDRAKSCFSDSLLDKRI